MKNHSIFPLPKLSFHVVDLIVDLIVDLMVDLIGDLMVDLIVDLMRLRCTVQWAMKRQCKTYDKMISSYYDKW